MRITPVGDSALRVALGDAITPETVNVVHRATRLLDAASLPGVVELVPAYTTITVYYDPVALASAGAPLDNLTDNL
jgi:inhibitor of KinA